LQKNSREMLNELDKEFKLAYDKVSNLNEIIATDIMLKLYAFDKQANFGNNFSFNGLHDVRNGFKFNAWAQLKDMEPDEAKAEYIKLVNIIINSKF